MFSLRMVRKARFFLALILVLTVRSKKVGTDRSVDIQRNDGNLLE